MTNQVDQFSPADAAAWLRKRAIENREFAALPQGQRAHLITADAALWAHFAFRFDQCAEVIERLMRDCEELTCGDPALALPGEPRVSTRGIEVSATNAQQAWYHVGQLAIVEPDLPVQKAVQKVYELCRAETGAPRPGIHIKNCTFEQLPNSAPSAAGGRDAEPSTNPCEGSVPATVGADPFVKCPKGHIAYARSFDECPSCKIERTQNRNANHG